MNGGTAIGKQTTTISYTHFKASLVVTKQYAVERAQNPHPPPIKVNKLKDVIYVMR